MKLLIALLAFLSLSVAHAGEIEALEKSAESFLERIIDEDIANAFNELVEGSQIIELQPQQISVTKSQLKAMLEIYGTPSSYEQICIREYSESLVSLIYMLKTDLVPITWNLTFYRARDEWSIVGFVFGDQLQGISVCQ